MHQHLQERLVADPFALGLPLTHTTACRELAARLTVLQVSHWFDQ